MRTELCAMLLAALALPASASDLPPAVQAVIDTAQADCESFEAGTFSMEDDAVQKIDLVGDTLLDFVIDSSKMSCSSAASMYCGTGGCALTLVVGRTPTERIARAWQVVTFYDKPVVLMDVHGSLCGGINPTPCIEALIWDKETKQFSTLAPREQ